MSGLVIGRVNIYSIWWYCQKASVVQNFNRIENRLNIKEVMIKNVLGMLTLLIQLKNPNSQLSKTLNTSIDCIDIHSIQCITHFDPLY